MILFRWLRKSLGRTKGGARRACGRRLQIEPLEPRWLPSINALVGLASNGLTPVGGTPGSRLIKNSLGDFFGTTESGGAFGKGTVYEMFSDGTIQTLASFNGTNTGASPYAGLVEDASGDLFGTTYQGGSSNDGTVFEVQYGGMRSITTLVNFTGTSGANPGQNPSDELVMDGNGNLFGTTRAGGLSSNDGEVFELPVFSTSISVLASFTGSNGAVPEAALTLDSSGNLFGTTSGGAAGNGVVFELQKERGYAMITLVTFPSGAFSGPTDTLIQDSSGNLYGTTQGGGPVDDGTVFELQLSGSSYTLSTLASFSSTMAMGYVPFGGVVRDAGGNLFGTTSDGGTSGNGTIFEVKNGSGAVTTLANFSGANGSAPPDGLLLDSSGNLFGTAPSGGAYNQGTLFELPAGSSAITALASFNGGTSGTGPSGFFEDSSGNLIGTAQQGGANNAGTIFKVPLATGVVTTLATFTGGNAGNPNSGLVMDGSGNLYGTSLGPGDGTIFELGAGSSAILALVDFTGTGGADPGQQPEGPLVLDSSGDLFGTTTSGGSSSNDGTVFELKSGTFQVSTLVTFTGSNGINPEQGLTMDSSGDLFGTTITGGPGTANLGTVFELKKTGSSYVFTTLATFTGLNGAKPDATLTLDSSGNLYGTTEIGGADFVSGGGGIGTVFELQKSGASYNLSTLASFRGSPAAFPRAGVIRDSSGNLFGTTAGGGEGLGLVYEVKSGSGTITPLAGFTAASGGFDPANLVEDGSGNLFGDADEDSVFGQGGIFEVPARTPPVITTTSLPAWTAQASGYNQTITATGGTGTATFSTSGTLPTGLTLFSGGVLSGTPTAAGGFSFTVTATDALGLTSSKSFTVTFNPAITLTSTAPSWSINQPGTSQTFQANGGTGALTFSQTGGTLPPGLTLSSGGVLSGTPTAVGSYTFTVAATDGVGAGGSQSFTVTINPGPPVKLQFVAQPASTPTGNLLPTVSVELLDYYGDVVTTDNTDSVTLGIASGPGGFTAGSTTTVTAHNGVATFSNLTLIIPGSYTLSELVPQLYTGPNSVAFSVLPLQVLPASFTGMPSGFSLQFNAAYLVNSLTPVLYGHGFGATAPVPSVTLTQTKDSNGNPANNPVEGSLVLNVASNSFTFLATNTAYETNNGSPILPDGTYTAVVHSGAAGDGLQAFNAGGGFLDGLGTGVSGSGDFTRTFVVNAATGHDTVVWVPDTADGPGQPLAAPGNNQAGGGYPVYLDSAGGVTSVLVTLDYNPALLAVSGVTGAGFTLLGGSTPGQALLQYSGPALAAGSQTPLGFVTASVPGGTAGNPTPYKAKDLLHLTNVSVNGSAGSVATSDGLHLVAYVGDANGDGAYSSDDAVKITRAALQADSGFTAYPLVDPVIVADTDGSGFIPADAALQVNEAGVGFLTVNLPSPPIPSDVVFQAIGNNVDPTLGLEVGDSGPGGRSNGIVTVTVDIDDAHPAGSTGLIEGDLALRYDPSHFMVSAADIHLGSVLAGRGWNLVSTVNSDTGEIAIAFWSAKPIQSSLGGSLVTIDMHPVTPVADASGSLDPIAIVASVDPSGTQVVPTELEDAQGTFTLSFAPFPSWGPYRGASAFFRARFHGFSCSGS
jgi:uncharacterized repeat protein (TIGR03803 family)